MMEEALILVYSLSNQVGPALIAGHGQARLRFNTVEHMAESWTTNNSDWQQFPQAWDPASTEFE